MKRIILALALLLIFSGCLEKRAYLVITNNFSSDMDTSYFDDQFIGPIPAGQTVTAKLTPANGYFTFAIGATFYQVIEYIYLAKGETETLIIDGTTPAEIIAP
ncbi:MAG: hypothetical protein ACM3WV_12430 [Bacillota bacterium]